MNLKNYFTNNVLNIPGYKTRRRIVVIESDDWGSVRMSSKKAYNELLNEGVPVDKDPYSKYDALESAKDLEELFLVLSNHRDLNGNPAIITANTTVANPDFEKISESDFLEYHFEYFTETLKRIHPNSNVFSTWEQGISNSVFHPQFHGREHLNVKAWMNELQSGNKFLLSAFNHQVFSIPIPSKGRQSRNNSMAAFNMQHPGEICDLKNILFEGLNIFSDIFKFRSKSIIFPCYIWPDEIEASLKSYGVHFIQGITYQFLPPYNPSKPKHRFHYTGQRNSPGQAYLVRNAFFEPSLTKSNNIISDCLFRIKTAFIWGNPAIVGTHRLNFIGSLDQRNRDRNLQLFDDLLTEITKRWPTVEFMSSDQLGNLITNLNELNSNDDKK